MTARRQRSGKSPAAEEDFPLLHDGKQPPPNAEGAPSSLLLMADATKQRLLKKESVDLVITSPPYNVGKEYNGRAKDDARPLRKYKEFSAKWLKNCYVWAKPGGRLCVNVSLDTNKYGKQPLAADITQWAIEVGWKYHATIIWNEGNISRRTAWGSWKSASAPHVIAPVEVIIVMYKDEWRRSHRGISDIAAEDFKDWVWGIWNFNGESGKRIGHEAPFPRELPRRCIKLFSFVGDTVLDPFSGSGTTIIEAMSGKRHAIGIEMERKYCQLSLKRIKKECPAAKLKPSSAARAQRFIQSCWQT